MPELGRTAQVTISSGQSLSNGVYLEGGTLVGVQMPAAWDASTNISFQASADGVTYNDVYTSAAEVTFSAASAASRYIDLGSSNVQLAGIKYLKVRSGSAASPTTQTADRVIKLVYI